MLTLAQIAHQVTELTTQQADGQWMSREERAKACRRLARDMEHLSRDLLAEADSLELQARRCSGDEVERALRPLMPPQATSAF